MYDKNILNRQVGFNYNTNAIFTVKIATDLACAQRRYPCVRVHISCAHMGPGADNATHAHT